MKLDKAGAFSPNISVKAFGAEAAMVRWLKERYAAYDWTLLGSLSPSRWEPVTGWKTGAPSYLPSIVASRQLQLRFNHPDTGDGHEVMTKKSVNGALMLYLDFINMFLFMLRLFGRRR